MQEYHNIKKFLQSVTFQIAQKNFFLLETNVISKFKGEEIVETFYKKNCKRHTKFNSQQKKLLKENKEDCKSNGEVKIIDLIFGLTKKILLCENELILTL